MPNTTTSPNMNLPVPTVSTDPGPDWATNVNASLSIIDGHNHAAGSGVPVTPQGMNINTDLSFNSQNGTQYRSVRFTSQGSPIAGATDIGCLYESGIDLYYNDGNGNQIRITQGGNVAGASGTITGLPSGTASASFSINTFTFQSATSTPAIVNTGPLVVGRNSASSPQVTIQPAVGIAGSYNFNLPAALPAVLNYMTLDNTGVLSYNTSGVTGSGAVVLATTPTLSQPTIATSATCPGMVINGGNEIFNGLGSPGAALSNGNYNFSLASAVVDWCIKNNVTGHQGIFTMYVTVHIGTAFSFFSGTTANCSVVQSGPNNSIFTVSGIGDGNTYVLTCSTSGFAVAANNTISSSSTANITLYAAARSFG